MNKDDISAKIKAIGDTPVPLKYVAVALGVTVLILRPPLVYTGFKNPKVLLSSQ